MSNKTELNSHNDELRAILGEVNEIPEPMEGGSYWSSVDTALVKALIERRDGLITRLPDGITRIGTYAFAACSGLSIETIPETVTSIEMYAFYAIEELALTSIPSGVKDIGSGAFGYCTGLTTMTFKGTPRKIELRAFGGCTNLLTINVPWAEGEVANAPWGATNATINYNYKEE